MNLRAHYRKATNDSADKYVVSVTALPEDGSPGYNHIGVIRGEENASRLVMAIAKWVEEPMPSKMNWVSNRLRNMPGHDRRQILDVLDHYQQAHSEGK